MWLSHWTVKFLCLSRLYTFAIVIKPNQTITVSLHWHLCLSSSLEGEPPDEWPVTHSRKHPLAHTHAHTCTLQFNLVTNSPVSKLRSSDFGRKLEGFGEKPMLPQGEHASWETVVKEGKKWYKAHDTINTFRMVWFSHSRCEPQVNGGIY